MGHRHLSGRGNQRRDGLCAERAKGLRADHKTVEGHIQELKEILGEAKDLPANMRPLGRVMRQALITRLAPALSEGR